MRLLNRAPIVLVGQAPPLSERQILRALRIPRLQRIDDVPERGLREAILKARARTSALTGFRAVFRTFPVERFTDESVVIERSSTALRSASLVRMLEGALFVTLFAVTLGESWDEALDDLADRKEAADAWFLDSIGTSIADRAARLVEDRAATDMARQGLQRTRRYRPGYGDFALESQAEICELVDAARVGVRVNEAFVLLPRKSISGVVGWRPRGGAEDPSEPESDGS
jgi:cobalamin-dependent methionine synthase I